MNGFSFVLASDVEGASPTEADERRFIVASPKGLEQEVTVEIDPETVAYVERMTRRELPAASSFWTIQASRLLNCPSQSVGKLSLSRAIKKVVGQLEVSCALIHASLERDG
jgi:hypothetical protein